MVSQLDCCQLFRGELIDNSLLKQQLEDRYDNEGAFFLNLFSLISNSNLLQLELTDYLLIHKGAICERQIIRDLDSSKFVVRESANRLMQKLVKHPELNLELVIDHADGHDTYQLVNPTATNGNHLYGLYLRETIQYRILMYLLDKSSYSVPRLATKLNVSESTLFRQTSQLNEQLAEFNLQIKNGHLYGGELQIVHFYYSLLWNSRPLTEFKAFREEVEIHQLTEKLEIMLTTKFDERTSLMIALWLKVCRVRLKLANDIKGEEYGESLKEAFQDPLYRQVLRAYNSVIVNNPTSRNIRNSLYLYLFIITELIRDNRNQLVLKTMNHASWENPFTVVNHHVDWVFTTSFKQLQLSNPTIEERLKDKWQPLFTQLFNQHYFFKGRIVFSFGDYRKHKRGESWERPDLATPLITILQERSLSVIDQADNRDYLELAYSHFFKFFLNDAMLYGQRKKIIGLYSKHGVPYLKNLARDFEHKLQLPNNYEIEMATTNQTYDLFIADSPYFLDVFKFKNSYLLNDFYSEGDLDNLETFVSQIAAHNFYEQNANSEF